MGLDTSHDCWHGAYGSFMRWRKAIALAAGYRLEEPGPENEYLRYVDLPWDRFEPEHFKGEWGNFVPGDDPLLYLLVHSDCDGVIHPEQGVHIAARLEQLLPKLDDGGGGHITARGGMREVTQQFIDGLRAAVSASEDVDFH